jgi:hypothetical protein
VYKHKALRCLFLKHNTSTLYDSSFENETHNFKVYDCLYDRFKISLICRYHLSVYRRQSFYHSIIVNYYRLLSNHHFYFDENAVWTRFAITAVPACFDKILVTHRRNTTKKVTFTSDLPLIPFIKRKEK